MSIGLRRELAFNNAVFVCFFLICHGIKHSRCESIACEFLSDECLVFFENLFAFFSFRLEFLKSDLISEYTHRFTSQQYDFHLSI